MVKAVIPIYICKENSFQRKMLERIVEKEVINNDYAVNITLSTGDPLEFLDFFDKAPRVAGLYFLDIELQHEMDGIYLAKKIREKDFMGKIIFVTASRDWTNLVFTHKIQALDYIIKEDLDQMVCRISECLSLAYRNLISEKNHKRDFFKVESGCGTYLAASEDAIYFEYIDNRKIRLYTKDRQLNLKGSIKKMENKGENFFYCHKSFVVNVTKVKKVCSKELEVEMINGATIPISIKKVKTLVERMQRQIG